VAQVPIYYNTNFFNSVQNIDSIKKNTETLIDASKEVDLELNAERTKYM
jgi:hypothetical protein